MKDLFDSNASILPFSIPNSADYIAKWNEPLQGFDIIIPKGKLFYAEHFFNKKISNRSLEYFLENDYCNWQTTNWRDIDPTTFAKINFRNIKWKQDFLRMYGKSIALPRYTSWYGDSGNDYTYSGVKSKPNEWNKGLLYLKQQAEKAANISFNSVLLNWYKDGEDYLNWHADDEKELGKNPIIASVNFGAERDFLIKKNDGSDKITIPLKHGTLLIMGGEMQHFWQHSVPKRKKIVTNRINLTFRLIHQ